MLLKMKMEERFRSVTTLERKERIRLLVWNAESLREYAARDDSAGRDD